jgi:single-stranded-DNA-specific exonuclease
LRLLGADVRYYIPHRIEEGYGLNVDALGQLAEQGAKLVVTVDCGVTAVEEARHARQLGLDLIITDHHQMKPELPRDCHIVHPALPGHDYPFLGLSGAGVAFKLAWALCKVASRSPKVSPPMRDFLLQATSLAALGTVADVVPLLDENRIIVRHGLQSMRQQPSIGLAALLKVAQQDKKPGLSAEDIAFGLAPRLNAAGRLGQAQLAVELLVTDSPTRAQSLAEYINELNASRQSLERSIYLRAHKQAQDEFDPQGDSALVLADRGWHPGVIGIVAGRVAEKFHRPVVMISFDELGVKPGVGSARSVPGFDLHAALVACAAHLVSYGGHSAAAGLKIEEQKLAAFREEFCQYAAGALAEVDRVAELWIDAEAPLSAFDLQTVQQIERLAPFGQGNVRPLLCATGVRLAEPPRRLGGSGRHLSMKIVQHGVTMRAVAFGGGDWETDLAAIDGPFSIVFQPTINDFAGRRRVELHVSDWRLDEVVAPLSAQV